MKARLLLSSMAVSASAILSASVIGAPDVTYHNIQGISNHGAMMVGDQSIRAYTLGSHTCNMGNTVLAWVNNGSPGLAMNMFRLKDGKLEQIGLSFVKRACCAASGSGCGVSCLGGGGGLGIGCMDVYSSGWNSGQGRLSSRSSINAFTGVFGPYDASGGSAIFKRLQVKDTDMTPAMNPGAQYFAEGIYVAQDDAPDNSPQPAGNAYNNASYKRVIVGAGNGLSESGSMLVATPAIFAWRDHGLGAGVPDPSVSVNNIDVPGEGRFIAASKVTDLGGGNFRYDYAIYNYNSDRSGGSFTVPIPTGVTVSDVSFHDVDYHSGEVYDNTDWTSSVGANGVTWSSPQTFAQNANSNAIRWGTMYNFSFTANSGPINGNTTLGLFKPGTPESINIGGPVPTPILPSADLDGDKIVGGKDLGILLLNWSIPPGSPGCGGDEPCNADLNADGTVDGIDLGIMLAAWTLGR